MTFTQFTLQLLALSYATVTYASPAAAAPAAPQVASLSKAVNVTSNDNPPGNKRFYRDGGYLGVVGKRSFKMNFDTCESGPIEGSNCNYVGGNSFTDIVSSSVLHDPNTTAITKLCESSEHHHTWVFNTIDIDGKTGLGYATDIGSPGETSLGVFPVIIDVSTTIPTCKRGSVLFPGGSSPQYGASGSLKGPNGYYVYLYGNKNGDSSDGVYVARVDPGKYSDLSAYVYWDGSKFNSDPSKAKSVVSYAPGTSVSYSNYYKGYLMLNTQNYFSGIGAQVAAYPWGPFSNRTVLFSDFSDAGGTYQPNALPQFDTSGKTLVVHYSAPVGFYQKSITVTFK